MYIYMYHMLSFSLRFTYGMFITYKCKVPLFNMQLYIYAGDVIYMHPNAYILLLEVFFIPEVF